VILVVVVLMSLMLGLIDLILGGGCQAAAGQLRSATWPSAGTWFTPTRVSSTRCKRALVERIARAGMQEKFGDVLVPTEEVVEMRGGQKRKSERKFFPGYVLVQIETSGEGGSAHRRRQLASGQGNPQGHGLHRRHRRQVRLPIKDSEADA
jgi:hypothetical protein